jgi:predicted O-methyltransferase YrrM
MSVLDRIFAAHGGGREGHSGASVEETKALREFVMSLPTEARVLEIGFNCGHSSWTMLATRADITVTSVDIGVHSYVKNAKAAIDEAFPGRHELLIGDSTVVVPSIEGPFDMYFIDGCHAYEYALRDMRNCIEKARSEKDLFVLDDVLPVDVEPHFWTAGPTAAWQHLVESAEIKPLGSAMSQNRLHGWVWGIKPYLPKLVQS